MEITMTGIPQHTLKTSSSLLFGDSPAILKNENRKKELQEIYDGYDTQEKALDIKVDELYRYARKSDRNEGICEWLMTAAAGFGIASIVALNTLCPSGLVFAIPGSLLAFGLLFKAKEACKKTGIERVNTYAIANYDRWTLKEKREALEEEIKAVDEKLNQLRAQKAEQSAALEAKPDGNLHPQLELQEDVLEIDGFKLPRKTMDLMRAGTRVH